MNMIRGGRKGFTIVELLIVVVVIAILAAITVVAYNGIRQRAVTTTITAAVDQWEKIIRMEIEKGTDFTGTDLTRATCLGRSVDDFPARDGFDAGSCYRVRTDETWINNFANYDARIFQGTSIALPSGIIPVTSLVFSSGGVDFTYQMRGVIGTFWSPAARAQNPETPTARLTWMPHTKGECGRGSSSAAASSAGIYDSIGELQADICQLSIE